MADGLAVAAFDEKLHATLAGLGIDVAIREQPYRVPTTTAFPEDHEHASYDRDAVERFWHVLEWTDEVLEEFAGWYCGKTSPVHLFWHSFDLALTRFGGERAPALPDANPVDAETYSHEVISFGFWAGDANVREPTYYSYTAPEPTGLRQQPLHPNEAVLDRVRERLARAPALRRGSDGLGPESCAPCVPGERVPGGGGPLRLGSAGARLVVVSEPTGAEQSPCGARTEPTTGGGLTDDLRAGAR